MEADKIKEITFVKDAIIVTLKPKGNRWAFSKGYHRFPIETMKEQLEQFAQRNNVQLVREA